MNISVLQSYRHSLDTPHSTSDTDKVECSLSTHLGIDGKQAVEEKDSKVKGSLSNGDVSLDVTNTPDCKCVIR